LGAFGLADPLGATVDAVGPSAPHQNGRSPAALRPLPGRRRPVPTCAAPTRLTEEHLRLPEFRVLRETDPVFRSDPGGRRADAALPSLALRGLSTPSLHVRLITWGAPIAPFRSRSSRGALTRPPVAPGNLPWMHPNRTPAAGAPFHHDRHPWEERGPGQSTSGERPMSGPSTLNFLPGETSRKPHPPALEDGAGGGGPRYARSPGPQRLGLQEAFPRSSR